MSSQGYLDSFNWSGQLKHKVGLDAKAGDDEVADLATKDDEVIDGLKRWLDRKDATFLDWLEQDEEFAKTECHAPEEVEALRETLAKYEGELGRMRKRLLTEEEFLQRETNQVDLSTVELSERLERIIEEKDQKAREVVRLEGLIKDLKSEFNRSLETVSKDKSSLIMKEMELREKESRLLAMNKDMDTRKSGMGFKASKDAEKEIVDRFDAELKDKEDQWKQRESELRAEVERLQRELTKQSVDLRIKEDQIKLGSLSSNDAGTEIEKKLAELQSREKETLLLKVQLENLKAEVSVREEEVNRLRESINNKEDQMGRREEELQYREKLLTAERLRFEDSKKDVVGVDQVEMRKKMEELGVEIKAKEEEVRNKEKWLRAKEEELRVRESGVIETEINTKQSEQLLEMQQAKAKTGNARLDDLLYGGIPFGSNIMVHGPPFIGKEVLVNAFVADGLTKGVPAVWVITDKTAKDIREEMKFVLSGYEEYEKKGLVRYIDSYSRSMGDDTQDPYSLYIDEPTDHERLTEVIDNVCKEFKEKYKYYRMAFRSVSTLIAYSDPNAAFRFLGPLMGRRKRDQAVSMFLVEKGMHGEQEIQMLGSIMDGMIDFKVDQMKTFFSVQGISDVQSRAYIRYTSTKHSLNIGSFALDHIR
jgi:KaiC/GvpD/RAD55 family RecA-like ATPase